ncbi:MAG: nucleotide pyrophosphohydrolase [Betaproteobacteria bacterium]|nr:nucleotide pyrophosphohydrolase [Betaproteobacteria bacterium]
MSEDIDALTEKLRAFANARDWSQFHSPKNLASALSVESGELLEHFQWLTDEQSRHLTVAQKQAVAMEVADVLLYLLRFCDTLGIDPLAAAHEKMVLNEQRYPVESARGNSKKYTEL